jgi:hypothetical protein
MRIRSFVSAVMLAALFAALPVSARAQSAADLVAKNLAARGGADKLAAIASIQFAGKTVFPGGFELAYKETRVRKDGKARIESSIQGLTLVQGYDGTMGWRINPFEGRRDAERMSADDTRALADDATIDGPLLAAKARGSAIAYLGREDFEGTDTYKLRVVDADGAEYVYFLDPDTYLEIKVVETRKVRGAPQVMLTEYGDYELVDGVYFPFAIESGPIGTTPVQRQQTTIDNAQANIPVSDASFAMPAAPSAK